MSRMNVLAAALLAVALGTPVSFGQADSWDKIERLIIAADKSREAAEAADAYLRSLTGGQLILAGRQCSGAMEEKFPPSTWDEAGANLGFFFLAVNTPET